MAFKYHVDASMDYVQLNIDTNKNESMYCKLTRDEAIYLRNALDRGIEACNALGNLNTSNLLLEGKYTKKTNNEDN